MLYPSIEFLNVGVLVPKFYSANNNFKSTAEQLQIAYFNFINSIDK